MKTWFLVFLVFGICFGQYDRSEWGRWYDNDKDGQNTRQEVLIEENLAPAESTVYDGKKIVKGMWVCVYTGDTITDPSKLDIDHFVPLKEAHVSGGVAWNEDQKKVYSNFLASPDHLIAVKAGANRSKGARDPSKWMPEKNKCWYLENWLEIKSYWDLEMNVDEQVFIEVYLDEYCQCK